MKDMTDDEILENVLDEFKKIAQIPRPSGNEEKISDFLKNFFTDLGFETIQDEVNNVIVNAPPTKDYENAPLTILQGHMDMVAVAADGVPFNPQKDPIRLLREEKYLRAMGTSLGADDGMGIAIIMFLAKHLKERGALRFIFTVDEEMGMKGASALNAKYFKDAKYLINCDSEKYDEIIKGCAGNITFEFNKNIKREPVDQNKNVVTIELTGLKGGHSGERIGDNRANAIIELMRAIRNLKTWGETELISINGGSARNAIPSLAKAVIATNIDIDTLKIALMEEGRSVYKNYDEEDAEFVIREGKADFGAITNDDAEMIFKFVNLIHSGVYAMNDNMVETSANLGIITTNENSVNISFLPRSSKDKKLDIFVTKAKDLAELTNFNVNHSEKALGWSQKTSELADIMAKNFKSVTGKDMEIKEMHAGIECGFFHKNNPNLDIVSIGTTNIDIHSPNERLELATVAPIVKLVAKTLKDIGGLR